MEPPGIEARVWILTEGSGEVGIVVSEFIMMVILEGRLL
jgi:hypothetical protein